MGKSKVMIVGSINQDIIFSNPIKPTEVGMMFADYTLANGEKGQTRRPQQVSWEQNLLL